MAPQRPEVPRSTTVYQALDHAVMKQQVTDGSDPGAAGGIANEWKKFGQRLVDAAIAFKTMEEGTSAMWSGRAAEGAQAQFAGFTKATETLGQQHNAVGNAIQTQASAAETARYAMPEPVPYEPGKMLKEAAGSGNPFKLAATLFTIPAQKAKSEEAKAQAVQVMQTRDSTFTSSAATMPTFTELPPTKDGPNEPPPRPLPHPIDPGGNDGRNVRPPGGIGTPPGPGTPPNIGMPLTPPPGPNRPGQGNTKTAWQTGNQNQQNQNQNQNQNQRPGQNPGQRPPIGGPFPPGSMPPGGGRGPGGAAAAKAGGGPGGFGGGKPGGSFGPSNPGGQGQAPGGRAGVMGPGGAGPQGGFGPSNAGSAARGAAGMGAGGMGAGAGQGQGDEDKEHKAAAYLVEAEDVFGDGETLVAPPVIGE